MTNFPSPVNYGIPGIYQTEAARAKVPRQMTRIARDWTSYGAHILGVGADTGILHYIYVFPQGYTTAQCRRREAAILDLMRAAGVDIAEGEALKSYPRYENYRRKK